MSTGPTACVREPLRIVDGHAVIPDRPGSGVVWDEGGARATAFENGAHCFARGVTPDAAT